MDPTAGNFEKIRSRGGASSSLAVSNKSSSYIMEEPEGITAATRISSVQLEASSRRSNRQTINSIVQRKSRVSYVVDVRHSGWDSTRISQASRPLLVQGEEEDDGSTTSNKSKSKMRKKKSIGSKIENIIPILPIEIAVVRFATVAILGWVLFYAMMLYNAQWVVEEFIPASFWFFSLYGNIPVVVNRSSNRSSIGLG